MPFLFVGIFIGFFIVDAFLLEYLCFKFLAQILQGGIKDGLEGGPVCASTVPFILNVIEMVGFGFFGILIYRRLATTRMNLGPLAVYSEKSDTLDKVIGVILTIVFTAEVSYKIITQKVMFLLQPCHIITAIMIYCLFSRSRTSDWLFTMSMGCMFGPVSAMILPETSCLRLPFEVEVYWIQHSIICSLPVYFLSRHSGKIAYFEHDWTWILSSAIFAVIFHFIILSPIAVVTEVNINFLLCPPPLLPIPPQIPPHFFRTATTFGSPIVSCAVAYIYILLARVTRSILGIKVPEKTKNL